MGASVEECAVGHPISAGPAKRHLDYSGTFRRLLLLIDSIGNTTYLKSMSDFAESFSYTWCSSSPITT